MMALVLGEEKRAKPNPSITRLTSRKVIAESCSRKIRRRSPIVAAVMPIEATIRGSILSESLPANGESKAITTGWATRIKPVVWGLKPLAYWR